MDSETIQATAAYNFMMRARVHVDICRCMRGGYKEGGGLRKTGFKQIGIF